MDYSLTPSAPKRQAHRTPEEDPSAFSPEEKTPSHAREVGTKAPGRGGQEASFSCPRCGHLMELWCLVFGKPQLIAQLLGIETEQKIPPNTLLSRADVSAVTA
jgi:hypothetical protein